MQVRFPVVLDKRVWFPDPAGMDAGSSPDGLVAVGGDLSIPRLLLAYRSGIFPWSVRPITWWSPDPRGVIELEGLHIPRSLERTLKKGVFEVTVNRAFREVVEACAEPHPGRESTWISRQFVDAYTALHEAGHAHSVECWADGVLVGGLYGVAIGGLFAGESMFHRKSDASKVAVCQLVWRLRERGYLLLDVQMTTNATEALGAVGIPRREYLRRLQVAVEHPARFL